MEAMFPHAEPETRHNLLSSSGWFGCAEGLPPVTENSRTMMIARLVSAAALVLVAASMAAPAAHADWRYERSADWRYQRSADWRYDEEWRWRHHPPHYHPSPRE